MLLAFGALIAAGLPVLLAGTSVAATVGILAPLSHLIHADSTVTSMIVLIGMAVGVDYSLFYLKREREERDKGHSTRDAVEIAAQTSGHSILVSGAAVICSMAGLFLLGDATFNSLAVGSIIVVSIAVLGSITVLPALLAKLGRWVDRPRVPLLHRVLRRTRRGAISGRVLAPVVKHPLVALVLATVVVVLLAVPALGMKTHSGNLETLPSSIPEAKTMQDLSTAFPSEGTTADLVVRADASQQDDVAAALADDRGHGREVAAVPPVRAPRSPVSKTAPSRCSPWRCRSRSPTTAWTTAIREIRSELAPSALDGLSGAHVEYAVGGDAGGVARLRRSSAVPAAAGDRVRAAADPADHGRDVPQRPDRAGLRGAEPGLGRRGVRADDAGLPARLVRERTGLQQPGLHHRLAAAVRAGGRWWGCPWTTTSSC